MWENAAQMKIVSWNSWQYAGRMWSHGYSAQPLNSHLAPKLKINTAHWNNSLHIGGLWYCPSDHSTSSVCARLYRTEDPWHDKACSRPGSAPFLAELQPTPGGQHCLVQLRWKGGHPCLGSSLTFDPTHAQLGSCLDSELASQWPQHPVGPKSCLVTCCMRWDIVLDVHKVTSKHPRRPWQHLIPQDLDVPMPVHGSIHHDQLTSPPINSTRTMSMEDVSTWVLERIQNI